MEPSRSGVAGDRHRDGQLETATVYNMAHSSDVQADDDGRLRLGPALDADRPEDVTGLQESARVAGTGGHWPGSPTLEGSPSLEKGVAAS